MTIAILVVLSTGAAAATATAGPATTDASACFRFNLQFGAHVRLMSSTDDPYETGSGVMISASLVGLKWDRRHTTWGVGFRGVNDRISRRLGPMVLVRSPLASSGNTYLQVAAGGYVFGGGVSPTAKYPAWFLEAEYAPSRSICLSVGAERVSYKYPYGMDWGYDMSDPQTPSYTDSSWYLGIKTGQAVNTAITDALVSVLAVPVRALGWSGGESEPVADGTLADTGSAPPEFIIQAQGGAFIRLSTNFTAQQKEPYLITGDVAVLRGSRTGSALGVGFHVALDVNGDRFGPKVVWRHGHGERAGRYFQVGAGVYVSSREDDFEPVLPGYFAELEYGLFSELALLGAIEVLPYADRYAGYASDPDRPWEGTEIREDGTAVNTFIGAKGGWKTTLAAAAVVGIVALVSQIENPMEF